MKKKKFNGIVDFYHQERMIERENNSNNKLLKLVIKEEDLVWLNYNYNSNNSNINHNILEEVAWMKLQMLWKE